MSGAEHFPTDPLVSVSPAVQAGFAWRADDVIEKLYACRQLIDQLPFSEPRARIRQLIRELSDDVANLAQIEPDPRQWDQPEQEAIERRAAP